MVGSDIGTLHNPFPLTHIGRVELSATHIRLLDKEVDISIVLLLDNSLESVGRNRRSGKGRTSKSLSSHNTLADLNIWKLYLLATNACREDQDKITLCHLWLVLKVGVDGHTLWHTIRDSGGISTYLLALEVISGSPHFTTSILKHWRYPHLGILIEPLSWEVDVNGCWHLTAN